MTTTESKAGKGAYLLAIVMTVVLGVSTAWAWQAAGAGTGLSSDMDGISMRDQGDTRTRGGRVYVGGGLRGGK